ncbi:MAG: hypothetical protein DMG60_13820 [Acidobacteria bacterium]|nr:MAG: hypothetical protein DMG60_13820 [Acidobacteriota bacterium]
MPGIAVSRQELIRPSRALSALRQPFVGAVRIAIITTAVAWLPPLLLSALGGVASVRGFLLDYAAQSRLLIVIGILIITEPGIVNRLDLIAQTFVDDKLIREEDRPKFESVLGKFRRLGNSLLGQAILLGIACLTTAFLVLQIEPDTFLPWCYGNGGVQNLSPAGSWYVLVSIPITFYLFLRWIGRQVLWTWFLFVVSRMNLQTIPAHPDRVAGLGFLETCHRKYIPFSFAMGTVVAGGVANRVLHGHRPLTYYRFHPLFVIAVVVAICAGPLCALFGTLLDAKRRGIFEYGALAMSVGRQFEQKWLAASREQQAALQVQDFSATIDLYSVVANVHQMDLFPLKASHLTRLAVCSLLPFIPVALASLPFEVVMKALIKLLIGG